jgi:S-adenosylmethionine/arginine decarboxylase-like enzyme
MVLNHKHLIVNAEILKPAKEGDERHMIEWLEAVVRAVNMKVVIGPHAHYCKADENEGLTASVNIETSHASLHIWDKTDPPLLRFDLYSCADYSVDTVMQYVMGFDPLLVQWVVLDRNDGLNIIERGSRSFFFNPRTDLPPEEPTPSSSDACTSPEAASGSRAAHPGIRISSVSSHTTNHPDDCSS